MFKGRPVARSFRVFHLIGVVVVGVIVLPVLIELRLVTTTLRVAVHAAAQRAAQSQYDVDVQLLVHYVIQETVHVYGAVREVDHDHLSRCGYVFAGCVR